MFGLPPFDHQRLGEMTVAQAHVVLQNHLDCDTTKCPRKDQAWNLLVATHVIRPIAGDRSI